MVDMFSANVMHLAQQKNSRLRAYCRQEVQDAETKNYDIIGKKTARLKTGRHSEVTYQDTPHTRRRVSTQTYFDSDLVDEDDKLKTVMNIENEYAVSIASALGRSIDEVIIAGALGTAYGGRSGASSYTLANANKVACFDGTTTTGVGLNVPVLRAVRKKFKKNEAIADNEDVVFAFAAEQADNLLGTTQTTNSDYAAIKALVDGEVGRFMGFLFVRTELLPFLSEDVSYNAVTGVVGSGTGTATAATTRRCFAFTNKKSVICSIGSEVKGKITEMPKLHYSMQVYGSVNVGAVRMEENQVVEVLCYEVQ